LYRSFVRVHIRCFNPRPRTRGDPRPIGCPGSIRCFNPRPRTRGDILPGGRSTSLESFNPRPRTRGDSPPVPGLVLLHSFNPRPRTRGDTGNAVGGDQGRVSIHAPARGATIAQVVMRRILRFQSTPPHEGRRRSPGWFPASPRFNPRPRTRGDAQKRTGKHGRPKVSIHAPARGATHLRPGRSGGESFNPRPRTRGDSGSSWKRRGDDVSIHAPARGATPQFAGAARCYTFQSTPPHEGRRV